MVALSTESLGRPLWAGRRRYVVVLVCSLLATGMPQPIPTVLAAGTQAVEGTRVDAGTPADEPTGLGAALAIQRQLIRAVAKAESSVVSIARVRREAIEGEEARRSVFPRGLNTRTLSPTDADFIPNEYGAGVVIDAAGLILTNYHVLGDPQTSIYFVWTQRRPFRATILAADPWYDLAVLKIDAKDLRPIEYGDGTSIKKGQLVLAIGNPQAIARDGEASVSWGIVSNVLRRAPRTPARSRDTLGRETLHHYGTLIQTDAKLNVGFSGGALVNLRGRMVGLTTSYAAGVQHEAAAGFAIPVDDRFQRVVKALSEGRKPDYGFLGVAPEPIELTLRQRGFHGARVARVLSGTPAYRAGVRQGDFIRRIDGRPVYDDDDLIRLVGALEPGRVAVLSVVRRNDLDEALAVLNSPRGRSRTTVEIDVLLSKKHVDALRPRIAEVVDPDWRGLQVDYVTAVPDFEDVAPRVDRDGCVIARRVTNESAAWKAGLRAGDLISHVGPSRVTTPGEFHAAANAIRGDARLRVITSQGKIDERIVSP